MKKVALSLAIVAMVALSASAATIVNGDFSDGLNGWTAWQGTWGNAADAQVIGGELHMTPISHDGSCGLYQIINVGAGTQIDLDALWSGNALDGGQGWVEFMAFEIPINDGAMAVAGIDASPPAPNAIRAKHDGWGMGMSPWGPNQLVDDDSLLAPLSFTTTLDYLVIGLKVGNASSMVIDNIVVPEPAGLVLLALGALPMMRRRRA